MLKMFCLYLFPFLLCLTCCSDLPERAKLRYQITQEHAQLVKKKYGFDLVAIGSRGPVKTEGVILGYASNRKVDVPQARRLFIDITQSLLDIINANEKIRPYLSNYPFIETNTEIKLYFFKKCSIFMDPPNVAVVSYIPSKNRIYYYYYDNVNGKFTKECDSESYAEAVEIVRKEREQSVTEPPSPPKPLPTPTTF